MTGLPGPLQDVARNRHLAIANALAVLVGLPLWAAGRAATMLWLQFGQRVSAPTVRDPTRITGEYALHLQCPWRISGPHGVVTGSADIFVPANRTAVVFDPGRPGDAVIDACLRDWTDAFSDAPVVVERVDVDRCGGFSLGLSGGFAVEVFPDSSQAVEDAPEQWRLLKPAEDAAYFVVQGNEAGYDRSDAHRRHVYADINPLIV